MATGTQQKENTLLHLFAGGCGGTVGAIFTCHLEVIKTRLQSSRLALRTVYYPQVHLGTISGAGMVRPTSVTPGLLQVLKSILEKEGPKSLFRGLGPNLVGVAPSRAVYFACYSKAKEQFNGIFVPNSNNVHILSAGSAAFVTNTLMNPIWMVKKRMQLERKVRGCKQMNTLQCARRVYQTEGVRGFYRVLTASYAGISETIICFAIYESLKKCLKDAPIVSSTDGAEKSSSGFFGLMAAAAVSKGCASCIAYPHEVIRTRSARKAASTGRSCRPRAWCSGRKATSPSTEDCLLSSSGRSPTLPLSCPPTSSSCTCWESVLSDRATWLCSRRIKLKTLEIFFSVDV
nr:unnamed protein product [Mus musculus]